jgi:oxygen-independent coproporphyrinogen III oxidase
MAGIYIHIPFCRKKCFYCDFYKSTAVIKKPLFLQSLHREIEQQSGYLEAEQVSTIYLGGGTPSVLTVSELAEILEWLHLKFRIDSNAEITLEANPDDLNLPYLKELKQLGFNRLSIGIQSFSDKDLKAMNRRHSAVQAVQSVYEAVDAGFSDISIDLIYGLPGLTLTQWEKNINRAVTLPVKHISAYHLTYHEGTKFYDWLKTGQLRELPEDDSVAQFEMLIDILQAEGFEQYEISNFALEKAYSKHNSSYWSDSKYLGMGPSAHSFDGVSRQWNVANLEKYIHAISADKPSFEREVLTQTDKLNDYLITRLRTQWGISLKYILENFGKEFGRQVLQSAQSFISSGHLLQNGDNISLTRSGIMISDKIMLALVVEN